MRALVRKTLAGLVVAATVAGGGIGAVQARALPVGTAQQVAGDAPLNEVGWRRRGGGAAALGAVAASRPSYGYDYGGSYARRVVLGPRSYGYRRAFYGPRFRNGRGGRRGR